MCLAETNAFGATDTFSKPLGPSLLFLEPSVTAAQWHGTNSDTEVRAYEVGVDTPLGPTESFFARIALLRLEANDPEGQTPLHEAQREVKQCRNKDCPQLKRSEGNDSILLKTWAGSFPAPDWGFDHRVNCLGQSVFSRIFKLAFASGVGACDNPPCRRRKAALDASAPTCSWPAFRGYITTLVACWTPVHLLEFIYVRMFSDHGSLLYSQSPCVDIQGALEVFIWARRMVEGALPRGIIGLQKLLGAVSNSIHDTPRSARVVQQFHDVWRLLTPLHDARGLKYARQCQERGICPTRVWNISMMSPYGVESIFHIANVIISALEANGSHATQSQHSTCSDQHCSMSTMNSTLAHQAHKCAHENCDQEVYFSPDTLNKAFTRLPKGGSTTWSNTAWQIHIDNVDLQSSSPRVMRLCDDKLDSYMAISHVWSDGTGVGMKKPGSVNRCLLDYFRKIAIDLDCTGIWWDTISLPTSREARNFALSNMLQNYEKAKITLIHDQELANFKWRDDGSPAVALILSSWFTRGWTAAELWASRHHPVKVVFARPNADPHGRSGQDIVLKDLDQDILGWDMSRCQRMDGSSDQWAVMSPVLDDIVNFDRPVPVLGHLVATDILKLLRQQQKPRYEVSNDLLSDVLQTLRPRITSWSIDQMVIAGLLVLPNGEFRAEWTAREITQKILISCRYIRVTDLIHGQVTIAAYGGRWDWCPPSIFDLGLAYGGSDPTDDICSISDDGTLTGNFLVFEIHDDDQILAYGSHPAHKARITRALSDKKHHFLLTTRYLMKNLHFVLFRPTCVYITECIGNWIGCCILQRLPVGRKDLFSSELIRCSFGSLLDPEKNMLPALDSRQLSWAIKAAKFASHKSAEAYPCLSGHHEQDATIDSVTYSPQQIWIIDPSMKSTHLDGDENGRFRRPPEPFVSAMAVIDRKVKGNQIERAFAASLPEFVMIEALSSSSEIVSLTWTFPHRYVGGPYPDNCRKTRKTFTLSFEIVPIIERDNEHWNILIGHDSFKRDIETILSFGQVTWSDQISKDGKTSRVWQSWKVLQIHHVTDCSCARCILRRKKEEDEAEAIFGQNGDPSIEQIHSWIFS